MNHGIYTGPLSNFILTRIRSLECGIGLIAAVCTLLLSRSRDPCHVPFRKFFQWSRHHFLRSMLAELEVCNFSRFGAISILSSPKNLRAHVTLATPTYRKHLSKVLLGLGTISITRLSNLKFVPSALLEPLAFNAPKFT